MKLVVDRIGTKDEGADRHEIRAFAARTQAILWTVGAAVLALGALVYLLDRPATHAGLAAQLGLAPGLLHFGAVADWLPSLAHTLAFSLFSASLLPPRPRSTVLACVFWFALNALFEVGQHPMIRGPLSDALRASLGEGPVARAFSGYFARGTFDVADLLAAAAGAALAVAITHRLRVDEEADHAISAPAS